METPSEGIKISELTSANFNDTQEFAVNDGGATKKVSDLTVLEVYTVKIVSSGAGAGEENWTGSGPYTTASIDTGLTGSAEDVVISFYDENEEPIIPLSPSLTDLSAVVFNSNSNADMYVVIHKE